MGLTWWVVVIAGCVGLAICIGAVLLIPMDTERRRPRLLANLDRLTGLPEYVRAARLRALSTAVVVALLVVTFTAAVLAGARPTGLTTATRESGAGQPVDIMVCVGAPVTDRAVGAVLGYFAKEVTEFGTQRIGLTSQNRRVIPLTRDYQYAAAQFGDYARPADQQGDTVSFSSPVSYSDYATNLEDVLALCLAGFPSFEQLTAQRRSLIYLGPESLRDPGTAQPTLFTTDRIRDLAATAGVQVDVLLNGPSSNVLEQLATDTGGQTYSADSNVAEHLSQIIANPTAAAAVADEATATKLPETPDVPLAVALLALSALSLWPVMVRR